MVRDKIKTSIAIKDNFNVKVSMPGENNGYCSFYAICTIDFCRVDGMAND